MPTIHPQQQSGAGGSNNNNNNNNNNNAAAPAQRPISRPPWVKGGPEPLPMPAAPWTLARARDRRISRDEPPPNVEPAPVRKQSKITIIPSQPNAENGVAEAKVKQEVINAAANKRQEQPNERKIDIQTTSKQTTPNEKKIDIQVEPKKAPREDAAASKQQQQQQQKADPPPKEKKIDIQVQSTKKEEAPKQQNAAPKERKLDIQVESKQTKKEAPPKERKAEIQRKPSTETPPNQQRKSSADVPPLQRKSSQPSIPPKPPAPPMPPPPMPGMEPKPVRPETAAKLEALKSRPRKRPDWGAMMKEVESGPKLKHVQCNDRSSPLLPKVKVKENFMYESEKPNVHNNLLKEIQSGVSLKKVKTNDRSKPLLEGLRKFRRQLTIEEQIQKAEDTPVETEPDELDDIDKVRDDLQSTKQMLALELRNKEAVERENKRLLARILNLEVELEKDKIAKEKTQSPSAEVKKNEGEKVVTKLKEELQETQKQAQDMEEKYHETACQLDMTRADLEEERRKIAALERRLANAGKEQPLTKQPSAKKLNSMTKINVAAANALSGPGQDDDEEDEESEYEEYTETEEDEEGSSEDEEKAAALREKRTQRELKLLNTKVYSLKEKEDNARKERRALRMQLKNQQAALKTEKKKYRELQKEVDKMSKLMNDDEEEEEEDEEEEESEEEESEESSSEESEVEESDGDLPPEAPVEDRKKNYTERAKKHENILSVLRKGNYLLKANVDKLKDDLFKQKEMSLVLQEDLNSVLAELG